MTPHTKLTVLNFLCSQLCLVSHRPQAVTATLSQPLHLTWWLKSPISKQSASGPRALNCWTCLLETPAVFRLTSHRPRSQTSSFLASFLSLTEPWGVGAGMLDLRRALAPLGFLSAKTSWLMPPHWSPMKTIHPCDVLLLQSHSQTFLILLSGLYTSPLCAHKHTHTHTLPQPTHYQIFNLTVWNLQGA